MTTKGAKSARISPPRRPRAKPAAQSAAARSATPITRINFRQVFEASAAEWVNIVKSGVPAVLIDVIARCMAIPKEKLVGTLGLGRTSVNRKARENKLLSSDESSRVLGVVRLVGQVQAMVEESGDPTGFNAAQWVAEWLERPLPALDGQRPAELMDTAEGQSFVAQLVARMQSGAYS